MVVEGYWKLKCRVCVAVDCLVLEQLLVSQKGSVTPQETRKEHRTVVGIVDSDYIRRTHE